jgi:2'-5' RNA ligase
VSKPRAHRLFFALNPDARTRGKVLRFQRELGRPGRPVPPQNFHVTLAFLGMQEAAVIPNVLEVASSLEFEPCRVRLDRTGRFKRAGVFWLGASELPAALECFQDRLVGALLEAGIGYDRKAWKFHLTLYRKMRTWPATIPPVAIDWELKSFHLIESVSVNRGVKYESIGHWKAGAMADDGQTV